MAKVVKKTNKRSLAPAVASKVKTKTRTVVKTIKKAGKINVTKRDIVLSVAGAGVGSVGGAILVQKMPAVVPDIAKNAIVAGLGGFIAYKGLKSKNMAFVGVGMGAAAAGAAGVIGSVMTKVSTPAVNGPYCLARPYVQTPTMNGPFVDLKTRAQVVKPYADEEAV